MKPLVFTSALQHRMAGFIALKQYSGSDYHSQAKLLWRFDRYLSVQHPTLRYLKPPVLDAYLATLSHLSRRGFANHYGVLRQFCLYLNQFKPASYVLPACRAVDRSYSRAPYIFSQEQVAALLEQCRKIDPAQQALASLYRTLFSVLYSTGIRISEALALDVTDYHPPDKLLHIRQGKFRKARYVVLSASCAAQLVAYLRVYQQRVAAEYQGPLFINTRHRRLGYQSAARIFHQLITEAGIENKGTNAPRLHDLRHTFAVHRLVQWVESADNLVAKLPVLSTYMGHVSVGSTQVYLQATNELLDAGARRFRRWVQDHMGEPFTEQ
jgi:site-specific recombinase XerD